MPRILVMEDDATDAGQYSATLRRSGHSVRLCRNGTEALEILQVDRFDLLIADMFVQSGETLAPDGGLLLISRVRNSGRSGAVGTPSTVPIIALASAMRYPHQEHFVDAARRMGATAVLPKPFLLDQFTTVVRELLTDALRPGA